MSCLKVVAMEMDRELLSLMTHRQKSEYMSLKAREAASRSARLSGFGDILAFPKDRYGVPQPVNNIYWGVSHKTGFVAGAVSGRPVGIDAEVIRPVSYRLALRISSDSERDLFGEYTDTVFFRIWTAKESVLKLAGTGLAGLGTCLIRHVLSDDHIIVEYKDFLYPVCSFVQGSFITSVVSLPGNAEFVYEPYIMS